MKEGEKILYTLDGTDPAKSTLEYKVPIQLSFGKITLRAVLVNKYSAVSEEIKYDYEIKEVGQVTKPVEKPVVDATATPVPKETTNNETPTPTPVATASINLANSIKIGTYVQMGKYNDEPILWRCVDIDENGPLMLADKILTIKAFDAAGNHKYLDGTAQADDSNGARTYGGSDLWETSNMRSWLNSTASAGNVTWLDGCPPTADKMYNGYNAYAGEKCFIAEGNFTASEQNTIKSVTQKSLLNGIDVKLREGGTASHAFSGDIGAVVQNYDTAYYQMVTDKMFLLNVKQLNKVYQNSSTLGTDYWIGTPTQKAVDNSGYKGGGLQAGSKWSDWENSTYADSSNPHNVCYARSDGYFDYISADYTGLGARPAFYINLSSEIFKSGNGSVGTPYVVN